MTDLLFKLFASGLAGLPVHYIPPAVEAVRRDVEYCTAAIEIGALATKLANRELRCHCSSNQSEASMTRYPINTNGESATAPITVITTSRYSKGFIVSSP